MTTVPGLDYDPFSVEAMSDPHPFYRRLRAESPVHYLPQYDTFVLSRFEDIREALRDPDGALSGVEGTVPSAEVLRRHHDGPPPVPGFDPLASWGRYPSPTYEQIRAAHGGSFRPRPVAGLTDRVRRLAADRLDELLPQGRFDLTHDFAGHVSAGVMCHLLGVPADQAPRVLDAVNGATLTTPGQGGVDPARLHAACLEILLDAVARCRAAGDEGSPIVRGLLELRLDGRPLTDREVASQLVVVLVGGTETVPKVTAHGLWELQRRPEQLAAVRADLAGRVPQAVEEMIRYCAPAQWFLRTALRPTVVAGQPVRPGQRVLMLFGSAARDEREYDAPDEFRWDRRIDRVLSFGRGQRFCIGFHLARLEVRVMVEELLSRVDGFVVDEAAAQRPPSSFQWGWTRVPVTVPVVAA